MGMNRGSKNQHSKCQIFSRYALILFAFYVAIIFKVGIMDYVEFKYVNREIYEMHNFPDVMGISEDEGNGFHAFLSGVVCSLPLLAFLAFKLNTLGAAIRFGFFYGGGPRILSLIHFILFILSTLSFGLVLLTYKLYTNSINETELDIDDIYWIHNWFYGIFITVEVFSNLSIYWLLFATEPEGKRELKSQSVADVNGLEQGLHYGTNDA